MVKSWHRLEAVNGLKNNYRTKVECEAARWLMVNHPHIRRKASEDVRDERDSGGGGGGEGGGMGGW